MTYAAPWSDTATDPNQAVAGVRPLDLPRAAGRRRLRALRHARRLLREVGPRHDLVLLHDPELLLAVIGQRRRLPPVVLDVHEDTAASLVDRPWIPGIFRPLSSWAATRMERWAERHLHLLLAEASYQARFRHPHPFIANVPPCPMAMPPPPDDNRVVYLGRIARSRGAEELLDVATRLDGEIQMDLIGPVDADIAPRLRAAVAAGQVSWTDFLPNDVALPRVDGAMAGLSLVHPQPNHAGSLQTKVLEYLSRRVPVISTDLPVTGRFIREHDVGLTVPAVDPDAVVSAIHALRDDAQRRREMGDRGFALIRDQLNWDTASTTFVRQLQLWAEAAPAGRQGSG